MQTVVVVQGLRKIFLVCQPVSSIVLKSSIFFPCHSNLSLYLILVICTANRSFHSWCWWYWCLWLWSCPSTAKTSSRWVTVCVFLSCRASHGVVSNVMPDRVSPVVSLCLAASHRHRQQLHLKYRADYSFLNLSHVKSCVRVVVQLVCC